MPEVCLPSALYRRKLLTPDLSDDRKGGWERRVKNKHKIRCKNKPKYIINHHKGNWKNWSEDRGLDFCIFTAAA